MLVLGIESSCDETGFALVREGKELLCNLIASQAELHATFGGVVPELSSRRHLELFVPLLERALSEAKVTLSEVELIAVANCPGLIGALLVGVHGAKALSLALDVPLVGVNHVEAHLYGAMMAHRELPSFPCLGLVISGGHTALWLMKSLGHYELLGHTVDDALGEAFDKVARMLELPYPGGPHIEKLAAQGDSSRFSALRAGQVKGQPLSFSFSGLKTAVLYALQKLEQPLSEQTRRDMAASFQKAAFQDLVQKVGVAAHRHGCKALCIGGGVAANSYLRALFKEQLPELDSFWPTRELSLDNAAMIAGLGYQLFLERGADGLGLETKSRFDHFDQWKEGIC